MYEKHILIFRKLSSMYEKLGDEIRSDAYHKLSKKLEAGDLNSVTEKSRKKINEITERGRLSILEEMERNPEIKNRIKLSNIIGVGPKQAENLVNKNITTFSQFKKMDKHTKLQKLGIKYYNKLSIPSPQVFKKIKNVITKGVSNLVKFEIAGSFRTGNNSPSDIDLIICTKTGEISPIIKILEEKKILEDYIKVGENDILGIAKLNKYYRIDIKCIVPKYFYSYLLYFGSGKYFSKYIRKVAKDKGYKLNQYGIENLKTKEFKTFRSEKSIFKFLDVPYYTPKERVKYF